MPISWCRISSINSMNFHIMDIGINQQVCNAIGSWLKVLNSSWCWYLGYFDKQKRFCFCCCHCGKKIIVVVIVEIINSYYFWYFSKCYYLLEQIRFHHWHDDCIDTYKYLLTGSLLSVVSLLVVVDINSYIRITILQTVYPIKDITLRFAIWLIAWATVEGSFWRRQPSSRDTSKPIISKVYKSQMHKNNHEPS